jgi:hypothetical protein
MVGLEHDRNPAIAPAAMPLYDFAPQRRKKDVDGRVQRGHDR